MIASATKKKTDKLDAERLSRHYLTEVLDESYVPSDDIQELRVLIAEREHFIKLATQCSNRINNIILRFGYTLGRGTSVTKDSEIRAVVEDNISENPSDHDNICPFPIPTDVKSIIQQEYELYDFYIGNEKLYLSKVRDKVLSMTWEIKKWSHIWL